MKLGGDEGDRYTLLAMASYTEPVWRAELRKCDRSGSDGKGLGTPGRRPVRVSRLSAVSVSVCARVSSPDDVRPVGLTESGGGAAESERQHSTRATVCLCGYRIRYPLWGVSIYKLRGVI